MARTTALQIVAALVLCVCPLPVSAAVPSVLHYQGVLTDAGGTPITTNTSVTFTLWSAPIAGTVRWTETRSITPDAEGRFAILLGQAVPLHDSVFKMPPLYLGVQVAADPELTPRSLLASNAFAFRISTVDGATGGNIVGDMEVQSSGSGTGLGIRDPGGDVGTVSSTSAVFADANSDTIAQFGDVGLRFIDPSADDTILNYDPLLSTLEIGVGNIAADTQSVAIGLNNIVTGRRSFAIGFNNQVDSSNSFAIGTANDARGRNSFVGGSNNIASGLNSAVLGGSDNQATAVASTVAGGSSNIADGSVATVCAGFLNHASGQYSMVGGGSDNIASGTQSVVGGGESCRASNSRAVVGGGRSNVASAAQSSILGGSFNVASGVGATVGGGGTDLVIDVNRAAGRCATVPGGLRNTALGNYAFAAGRRAKANHGGTFVWADSTDADFASSGDNQFLIRAAGGVGVNTDAPMAQMCVFEDESGSKTSITQDMSNAGLAIVTNYSSGSYTPGVFWSTLNNSPTQPKAGIFLRETNSGSRMYLGTSNTYTAGITNDGIVIDENGSVGLNILPNYPIHLVSGAHCTVGGVWTNASDANRKENFKAVDPREMLDKVAKLPITQWNYRNEDPSITHIGPTAQDFLATFGVGGDDKSISTIDPSGIALAAIQALNEKNQSLEAETAELRRMIKALQDQLNTTNPGNAR